MEWFHFTDFHIGKSNETQTTALASLIDAVKLAAKNSTKIDAVFITGDIAQSGLSEQYEKFKQDFLLPLKKIDAFSSAQIFAIPGNHDADCDAHLPIEWDSIGKRNQEKFFSEEESGRITRSGRSAVFSAYREFVKANGIVSPDPSQEVSLYFSDERYPFDIIATNTAFFADKDKDSSGETTPSPLESIRYVVSKKSIVKPIIILAHHPLSCFIKSNQPPFENFLKEKRAVYLHGHEHAPHATFGRERLRTLGFGASYISSLPSPSSAPYLNSFTRCHLEGSQLTVNCFSWQDGVWTDMTASQLPECIPDDTIEGSSGTVQFPVIGDTAINKGTTVPLTSVHRSPPKPSQLIPIDAYDDKMGSKLFCISSNLRTIYKRGEPKFRQLAQDSVKLKFELEQENGQRNLLIFIWALNHILSSKEIEAINTEVDTEGFATATVISIGKISTEANIMYLRLKARKPIEVLVNEGITSESEFLLTTKQAEAISILDSAHSSITLLLGEDGIYVLIIDETGQGQRNFRIVDENGYIVPSTDESVTKLRQLDPNFTAMAYTDEKDHNLTTTPPSFHENSYLSEYHRQHNIMKYAALDNVGLRFADLTLEDVYINATASETSETSSRHVENILEDHLSSYPLSEELKQHIHNQMLEQGERQEVSGAREFCQKYSAVLITGDPGSGKTCFVRSEILAYCKRALDKPADDVDKTDHATDQHLEITGQSSHFGWHSSHIPIMVPLAEAVAEKDLEEKGMFAIASRLLERRSLHFPEEEIRNKAIKGQIALFFDGLDEVVSIEKRALVVKHINELVTSYLPFGNRIIVTSRPAAIQVVNLLPDLHKLELQGLSEPEIRTLARRILNLELSADSQDIQIGDGGGTQRDHIVISQLINDCNRNPGVARMAQNPLLLTLLIMIYANSGTPSAKRHKIYEQAINTLASVRRREAGHQPISVQDLRERLGAVGLSVYKQESGLLPKRSEVNEIVRSVMERQRGQAVPLVEANAFIQKVAESTGLIVPGKSGEESSQSIVTFMHHSFLEYFAAIGLSNELEQTDVCTLVSEARWREILTLLAGIIGENKDVSPIIKRFLDAGSNEPDIDARLLLFAIDCALECEVPSEAAQRLLADSINSCLTNGSGRQDSWVRSEIGQRLELLISACGGSEFDGMIAQLIRTGDEETCAAAIEVLGHICSNGYSSPVLSSAFEFACSRTEDGVLSAICIAASRSRALRTNAAEQIIATCLKRSRHNRRAAFEALANIPTLSATHWPDIINGIDDNSSGVSRWASIAAMNAGLNVDVISLTASRKDVLIHALEQIDMIGTHDEIRYPNMKMDTLEVLAKCSACLFKQVVLRVSCSSSHGELCFSGYS